MKRRDSLTHTAGSLGAAWAAATQFALSLGALDAFTIGAESINEQQDLIQRIAAVKAA